MYTLNFLINYFIAILATAVSVVIVVESEPVPSAGVVSLAGLTSTLLKTDGSNNIVAAVAGTDYLTSANLFGKAFEINGAYLAPTTTQTILANGGFVSQASSTVVGAFTVSGANIADATLRFYSSLSDKERDSLLNLSIYSRD